MGTRKNDKLLGFSDSLERPDTTQTTQSGAGVVIELLSNTFFLLSLLEYFVFDILHRNDYE